jgi:Holliday junction resolvase RusA-like endonuclease
VIALRIDAPVPTQGSMSCFRRGSRCVVVHSKPAAITAWRAAVSAAWEAERVLRLGQAVLDGGPAFPSGPVEVEATFDLVRPRTSREPAPTRQRSGDLDKLTRALLDALTECGVWADDAQVTALTVVKRWADSPGASVTIRPHRAPDV